MLPQVKKLLRAHYVDAIVLARHPVSVEDRHDDAGVQVIPDDDNDDCVVDDSNDCVVDDSSKEIMAKKLLAGFNTITQLKAIMAKEKIKIEPGMKNKTDYINAIYSARKSKK